MYFCNFIMGTGTLIKFFVLVLPLSGFVTSMVLKQYARIVYSVGS